MSVALTPHLNFRSQAREALEFYRSVFGGELVAVTYGDMGNAEVQADLVVWGQVAADNGFRVMAYDVPPAVPLDRGQDPVFLSLRGDSAEEITQWWKQLCEGATITAPLAPSAFAPLYGMLTDRFGITWVVDVAAPHDPS